MISKENKLYSVFLQIADINFCLSVESKVVYLFLKKKYTDYLSKSNRHTVFIKIQIVSREKCRSKPLLRNNDDSFILYTISPNKNFAYFNDAFLQIFIRIMNDRSGLVIHASTLCYKNKGYIFMGHEGAGKSTIRKICKPIESLGDDIAIIKLNRRKYYLYGSPFYQRTRKAYSNKKVVINGIFNIKQNNYTKIEKLSHYDSFVSTRQNVFSVKNLIKQNEQIISLVKDVDVYQLDFEKNDEFWKLISGRYFSFLHKKNFKNTLDKINSGLLISPKHKQWIPVVANQSFIYSLNVINEMSWNFEFSKLKLVKEVCEYIKNPKNFGAHTKLIRKYTKKSIMRSLIIVCLKINNKFEIIDGNHRTVARSIKDNTHFYRLIYAN